MTRTVALLLLLSACAKRGEIGSVYRKDDGPVSKLGCPEGTVEVGAPPPTGTELSCVRTDETGRQVKHGPARTWWPDGRPRSHGAYAADQRVGHWWLWSADGHLEMEGDFRENAENGWWVYYRPDGGVSAEGPMRNGGRDGMWVTYDETTGLAQEGLWVGGEKEGVWVEYNADDRAIRERVFRRGRLLSQREL